MTGIQFVKSETDFDNYVSNNKYLVVNFTAQWCGPCQAIKPIVDQMYDSSEFQALEVIRVDLDTQQGLAGKYGITSIPTFLFMKQGNIVDKLTGAGNVRGGFEKLATMAKQDDPHAQRNGNGSSTDTTTSNNSTGVSHLKEITKYVPKGYNVLNSTVYGGDFEALNTVPLQKDGHVKEVFDLNKDNTCIFSDADSQMLLYVPLTHISKIYSILIKTNKPIKSLENLNLDSDDLDEIQLPNLIKIWGNKLNILSFDDAASNSTPQHLQSLQLESDGWYECKLKYVRFQNVQSLNIFIDGDDDDNHTMIEKIAIIGIGGEEKDHHNMMDKLTGEEEH